MDVRIYNNLNKFYGKQTTCKQVYGCTNLQQPVNKFYGCTNLQQPVNKFYGCTESTTTYL